jgi:hypothetical protein
MISEQIKNLALKVRMVDKMTKESVANISNMASGLAPAVVNISHTDDTITASGVIAAYIEFGTGAFAASYTSTLPKEWDEYAYLFKTNFDGKTKESPFLYRSYETEVRRLNNQIKELFR